MQVFKGEFTRLNKREFLKKFWQKRPLLLRGAFPRVAELLCRKDLLMLACKGEPNSRLVRQNFAGQSWHLTHGPFRKTDFSKLGKQKWTVLVSDVEKFLPKEFAALRRQFRFIPDWRFDDIMVSYATHLGGVGPHVDNYDVFLIQGAGQRRWLVDEKKILAKNENYFSDLDLRVLKKFKAHCDLLLQPGDALYLPPRLAHYGIAEGECMTFSVGFRAPTRSDLMQSWLEFVLNQSEGNDFYTDPDLSLAKDPRQISQKAKKRLLSMMKPLFAPSPKTWERFLNKFLLRK